MTYARCCQEVWITMELYKYVSRKDPILNHMYCLKLLDQRLYTVFSISWKKNNSLYYDIDINLDNIVKNWVIAIETNEDQNIPDCHIQKTKVINRDHITFIDDNQPLKISDFSIKDDSAEKGNVEEESNPLDDYRIPSSETAYVAEVQYDLRDDAGLAKAPGENKMSFPIISDESCELLAHLYLFLTRKFRCTYQRGISLSPSK